MLVCQPLHHVRISNRLSLLTPILNLHIFKLLWKVCKFEINVVYVDVILPRIVLRLPIVRKAAFSSLTNVFLSSFLGWCRFGLPHDQAAFVGLQGTKGHVTEPLGLHHWTARMDRYDFCYTLPSRWHGSCKALGCLLSRHLAGQESAIAGSWSTKEFP